MNSSLLQDVLSKISVQNYYNKDVRDQIVTTLHNNHNLNSINQKLIRTHFFEYLNELLKKLIASVSVCLKSR